MARRRSIKRALTLEEKLEAMPPRPRLDPREPWMDRAGSIAQVEWDRHRAVLREAIKARDAKRMRDGGRDAGGNFGVSTFAARGHKVEVAPKDLGKELPRESTKPERISTQRVIDRLSLSASERRAAEALLDAWNEAATGDRLTAGYSPVTVQTSNNTDHLVEKRLDAAMAFIALRAMIPARCIGVVMHVVINDWELSDWGIRTAQHERTRRRHGAKRLSQGLRALAARLRC